MNKLPITIAIVTLSLLLSGCNNPFLKTIQTSYDTAATAINEGSKAIEEVISNPKAASVEEKLAAQSTIKKFSNLDEAREFLAQMAVTDSYYNYRMLEKTDNMLWGDLQAPTGFDEAGAISNQASKAASNSKNDYSQTNIQVEGVDEPDIVKSDGEYVYVISKKDLFIIKAYPTDQAEIVSKIQFKSRPSDIFINEDKIAVFGGNPMILETALYKSFRRQNEYTFFKVFDIADKKNPKLVRELDLEGSYSDARMIGDYVYLVTADYNYSYIDGEPVLPRVLDKGEVLPEKCQDKAKCFTPDVYYFDLPYTSYNFTNVTAINIKNNEESISGDLYLMSNTQNIYVSPQAMYITYTKYISEQQIRMGVLEEFLLPRMPENDRKKITAIENTENYILTQEEKMSKIEQIITRYLTSLSNDEQSSIEKELQEKIDQKYEDISKEMEKTVIHKIVLDGKNIEYKTFGEVTGNVLNQFSMDENNGFFRIATTKNRDWLVRPIAAGKMSESESYNNLYVLDDEMKQVGAIERIAEGERIYSVRFIGSRAYMVTFQQTDPLFVIDLGDPRAPKILGELKIPGFSNYLHPYDENTLIGFGKETTSNQWGGVTTKGVKLSLFDVSNVAEPKEIDTYVMGGSGSDSLALSDHKAFLFSKSKNLLSVPVSLNEGQARLVFSGAMVFSVNQNGFKMKGKIDHSDGGRSSESDYWHGYGFYDNSVQRSLYIKDVLYTLSNNYLLLNNIDDLKELKKIELKKERIDGQDFIIVN